ncbi:hypothetical protein E2562_033321 [Oryza meyeriana var. granulata]|uniref:Uncharacterized protein n=1 Tax=Oryza meyeriana var. granulata TaxID=110450 RepID=A0A6G1F0Z8_9ORYZ|nr:hypothetical protein E2562_033321 [Oryza meyeriana var. granulata]
MAHSDLVLQPMKFGAKEKSYRSQAPSVASCYPTLVACSGPPTPDARRRRQSPDGAPASPVAAEGRRVTGGRIPRWKQRKSTLYC